MPFAVPLPFIHGSGLASGSKSESAAAQVSVFQHAPPPRKSMTTRLMVPGRTQKRYGAPLAHVVGAPGAISFQPAGSAVIGPVAGGPPAGPPSSESEPQPATPARSASASAPFTHDECRIV